MAISGAINLGKWAVEKIIGHRQRPIIEIVEVEEEPVHVFVPGSSELEQISTIHRAVVENTGKSPAENCRPSIEFLGKDGEVTYQLSRPISWTNYDHRGISINPEDNATVDVALVGGMPMPLSEGEGVQETPLFNDGVGRVESLIFGSKNTWSDEDLKSQTWFHKTDKIPAEVEEKDIMMGGISASNIPNMDVEKFNVKVTSANADAIEADLRFTSENDGLNISVAGGESGEI